MKIVQISGGEIKIPTSVGGGVETFIFNLSKELYKNGHNVTILDRKYSPSDLDTEKIEGITIKRLKAGIFNVPGSTIDFVLGQVVYAFKINKYLKTLQGVDAVNVHHSVLGNVIISLNRKIRAKMYYTSHSLRREKVIRGITDMMALELENHLIRNVKKTMIANEIVAEQLAQQAGVKPKRVQVVRVGVDIAQFNPDLDTIEVRQRYGLEEKRNILFVGRICVEKGVEYLVKAADLLVNRLGNNNLQFLVVGPIEQFDTKNNIPSPYFALVNRLINEYHLYGVIRLLGVVPLVDLRILYTACDMVVIPSIIDLDPQVQIEAMASGKPVIGTRVGTMPRRIKDGISGFIIDPANEEQLADKIKYLLDNPTAMIKMGINARELVMEKYSA
ncbi:MAG: hypothetical protein A2Z74_03165, partial [Chloroflexi bacterium RBG_13_46_9]